MKMELLLEGAYEQLYDIAYKGKIHPKEEFRCVSINDKNFKCDPTHDEFEQFSKHLQKKIIPLIKQQLDSKYLIHDISGEQGQLHPHLIIRRADFRTLDELECQNIEQTFAELLQKINTTPEKKNSFNSATSIFSSIPTASVESQANKDHYQQRI